MNSDCGSGHTCTAPAPGGPCSANEDCVSPAACNLSAGEGGGAAFFTQGRVPSTSQTPSFLYLINQPSKTLHVGALPPPFNSFIKGVCVSVTRSEGWCDCSNAGLPINTTACVDHITNGDCRAAGQSSTCTAGGSGGASIGETGCASNADCDGASPGSGVCTNSPRAC